MTIARVKLGESENVSFEVSCDSEDKMNVRLVLTGPEFSIIYPGIQKKEATNFEIVTKEKFGFGTFPARLEIIIGKTIQRIYTTFKDIVEFTPGVFAVVEEDTESVQDIIKRIMPVGVAPVHEPVRSLSDLLSEHKVAHEPVMVHEEMPDVHALLSAQYIVYDEPVIKESTKSVSELMASTKVKGDVTREITKSQSVATLLKNINKT